MQRVLISSCLLGERVRYNGDHKRMDDETLARWRAEGRVVAVCPELAGGLGVPRLPAEIAGAGGGTAVLASSARVMDSAGNDVTTVFVAGARRALEVAQAQGIHVAVLKDRSPSCGVTTIHDGTFQGGLKPGELGVAAALLREHGIAVFSEHQIALAAVRLEELERSPQQL